MTVDRADPQGDTTAAIADAVAAVGQQQQDVQPMTLALDLDAWKGDLQKLHSSIDQVVQSFIGTQTRQLDAVAAELASQRERIMSREQRFTELSDSIAGFVEAEAQRLEASGFQLTDPEADARQEAYDAELPGSPVLHRINRLWRKTTRAFEAMRECNEQDSTKALEDQRKRLEAEVAAVEERCAAIQVERAAEKAALEANLAALQGEGQNKAESVEKLSEEATNLAKALVAVKAELAGKDEALQEAETSKCRAQYEWEAEREDLKRRGEKAEAHVIELQRNVAEAGNRERSLERTCTEQLQKLEQMRRVMDDQERELNQKIEKVQQYVTERQAGFQHVQKKQQDAERLAERWQGEVKRLQSEKDRMMRAMADLEGKTSGQASQLTREFERQQQELTAMRESLERKEEEMRASNLELLQQRDSECQAKLQSETQKEKNRSVALLKKKEQELKIKDEQLQAARRRLQELEGGSGFADRGTPRGESHSRGSTGSSIRRPSASMSSDALPPLPLSAR